MDAKKIKILYLKYKNNPLAVFLFKGFVFFAIWNLLLYPYVISDEMNNWLIYQLVDVSVVVLSHFFPMVTGNGTELYIHSKHLVHIGIPCNGIDVMGVFACIVLAFSARWYHKVWVILLACFMIFLLNVARISGLSALLIGHHIRAFDINHKYIFNAALYTVLLILFSSWSSKFGKTSLGMASRT